ncbi:MAG: hypothetical protein A4E65_00281 [Syntrophorhabdus sp. PtaU1.Bin153]|nr:MAG: hypothetical protein A4E65_00281 [Syntrophorhabdus sp. PtaU1.Bin153]
MNADKEFWQDNKTSYILEDVATKAAHLMLQVLLGDGVISEEMYNRYKTGLGSFVKPRGWYSANFPGFLSETSSNVTDELVMTLHWKKYSKGE